MFGLGNKGKLTIELNKDCYAPGDIIQGTISLKINNPLHSRGLHVNIYGFQTIVKDLGDRKTTTRLDVFDENILLEGEQEYRSAKPLKFAFTMKLPTKVKRIEDTIWKIHAYLDIPDAPDLSDMTDFIVQEPQVV